MHRVTTTNYKESLETGKIFLGKLFIKSINSLNKKKIKRCKECSCIINSKYGDEENYYYKFGYCSLWCKEINSTKKIKHTCKKCGVALKSYKRKNGTSYGMYPKYCPKHNPHNPNRDKIVDLLDGI